MRQQSLANTLYGSAFAMDRHLNRNHLSILFDLFRKHILLGIQPQQYLAQHLVKLNYEHQRGPLL